MRQIHDKQTKHIAYYKSMTIAPRLYMELCCMPACGMKKERYRLVASVYNGTRIRPDLKISL